MYYILKLVCSQCKSIKKVYIHIFQLPLIFKMSSELRHPEVAKRRKRDDARCIICNKFLRKITGNPKLIDNEEYAQKVSVVFEKNVLLRDQICYFCRTQLRKHDADEKKKQNKGQMHEVEQDNVPTIHVAPESNVAAPEPIVDVGPDSNVDVATKVIDQKNFDYSSSQDICSLPLSQQTSSGLKGYESSAVESSQSSTGDPSFVVAPRKETMEVEVVEMPFHRVVSTHAYCFICASVTGIETVPFEARIQVFVDKRIYIPGGNRCCSIHLIKDRFFEDELDDIRIFSNSSVIPVTEIHKFLEKLSTDVDSELHNKIGEYTISEERIQAFTGYTWENIICLKEMMDVHMRKSSGRNITQALVTFLFKLRSGNSDKLISAILGIDDEKNVAAFIKSVLNCFEQHILPSNFGYKAYCRQFLIDHHTAPAAKKIHDLPPNHLAIICDGTYLRHEKSANYAYQRKSYSGQKKTALCKPFTVCCTDGFVIDVSGPFLATKNDAEIFLNILSDPHGLRATLRENDLLVLDRGFRDAVPKLEAMGFRVLMPALKGKRNQLTAKESNESRLVTKVRWVVEAVHGIIGQKFKLLHHQLHNTLLPNAATYCKIACFLVNKFGKRLNSDDGNLDEIINRIESQKSDLNTLADEVEKENWNRKTAPFQVLSTTELLDFPRMDLKDLKVFFTGTYQLSQAVSYLVEMLEDDNTVFISYLKLNPDIIRFEVRSRHISRKTYKCYIHYKPDGTGVDSILHYCCTCANGNRTIGCCSHVAAMVYYLSHARFLSRILRPANTLTKLFNFENVIPVVDEDSDED